MDYHGNWTCIEGLKGGFDPGKFVESNCTYEPALFDSDWNSFMCISKSRTSYLGLYYDELLSYDSKLSPASTSPKGSYVKTFTNPPFYRKIYKYGYPVKVVYNEYEGLYGNLNIPSSLGPTCVWSPIAYLKDSVAKCHKNLTPKVCTRNTMLDYQMYLMPLPKGVDATNIPKVLVNPANNTKVPINFNYYFAKDPDLYLTTQFEKSSKIQRKVLEDKVDDLREILQSMRRDDEGEDAKIGVFLGISSDKCVKMERFSDDQRSEGRRQRQEDQVHLQDSKCINAVLEVNYEIFWIGNEITRMNANILLGNLTLIETKDNIPKSASQFQVSLNLDPFFSRENSKHEIWLF